MQRKQEKTENSNWRKQKKKKKFKRALQSLCKSIREIPQKMRLCCNRHRRQEDSCIHGKLRGRNFWSYNLASHFIHKDHHPANREHYHKILLCLFLIPWKWIDKNWHKDSRQIHYSSENNLWWVPQTEESYHRHLFRGICWCHCSLWQICILVKHRNKGRKSSAAQTIVEV